MNKRTRAYTRHQRARTIERKWFILKHIWQREPEYMPVKGTLSKNKIHCSCRMCRYEQYHGIPKAKYKARWAEMKKEMDYCDSTCKICGRSGCWQNYAQVCWSDGWI